MAFLGRVDALPQLLIKLALRQVVFCIQDEAQKVNFCVRLYGTHETNVGVEEAK